MPVPSSAITCGQTKTPSPLIKELQFICHFFKKSGFIKSEEMYKTFGKFAVYLRKQAADHPLKDV
jgi:hypothetical protein